MGGAGQAAGSAPHAALLGGGRLLAEETRQVSGHGGIGGVGQSHFLQAGAALAGGHIAARYGGEEAVAKQALEIGALQLCLDGAAHHARAFAEDSDGRLVLLVAGFEQLLLGGAAIVPERLKLEVVDFGALLRELIGDQAGDKFTGG